MQQNFFRLFVIFCPEQSLMPRNFPEFVTDKKPLKIEFHLHTGSTSGHWKIRTQSFSFHWSARAFRNYYILDLGMIIRITNIICWTNWIIFSSQVKKTCLWANQCLMFVFRPVEIDGDEDGSLQNGWTVSWKGSRDAGISWNKTLQISSHLLPNKIVSM